MLTRRDFIKNTSLALASGSIAGCVEMQRNDINVGGSVRTNVILCMADDLGWGDTGYNGHAVLKTPNLDAMAAGGIRFDRFYSGAPVCSPTRASCLTGRHPYRHGIFYANVGNLPKEELTLAEVLKRSGYATGHFGKWHLGTLTRTVKDSNRGGVKNAEHYSPPTEHGFDVCFCTEAKVPTYNPMYKPGTKKFFGTRYWREDGKSVAIDSGLVQGDDSRIIMDQAIDFIREKVKHDKDFFCVIWFHAPHLPVVADAEHKAMYRGFDEEEQNYYGCITAMDEQIGRLRKKLRQFGAADNTMLWFCSDNGPEGQKGTSPGSSGPLRGRKRSLYEGGIRVPGLLEWPAKIRGGQVVTTPGCTSDYFPTVMEYLGLEGADLPTPRDGISLAGIIENRTVERTKPIAFESRGQVALIDNLYKLYSKDGGENFELYDLVEDISESMDLANEKPEIVKRMARTLEEWRESCKNSLAGNDYK